MATVAAALQLVRAPVTPRDEGRVTVLPPAQDTAPGKRAHRPPWWGWAISALDRSALTIPAGEDTELVMNFCPQTAAVSVWFFFIPFLKAKVYWEASGK